MICKELDHGELGHPSSDHPLLPPVENSFNSDSLPSEFAEALDEWFVIVKPFRLEFTHNGKEVRNQLKLMRFQESAKAAYDIEAMDRSK